MATARTVTIPSFDFSGNYYPELLRALIQYQRLYVPEITDESDEEPFQQLLRCYALVGHLNNVKLDIVANESLLPTSRLLESVRGHLALIDVTLQQASPASTDVILKLSKIFTTAIELVPEDSQFATVETDESPQIIFENNESFTIQPSNVTTGIYTFTAGKIKVLNNTFDAGDAVTIESVDFRYGIEWTDGATIPDTLDNIVTSINTSVASNILDRVHAISDGIDTISLIPLSEDVESITVTETDNATDNFEVLSGGFGADRSGLASTDSVFFDLYSDTPKIGDTIYIGHTNVMSTTLEFVFNTFGSGIDFVVEYYDGNLEDANPDSVTNLGSNLEFDLTTLLGSSDRSGTIVRVVYSQSGAEETRVSQYVGGKNIIQTLGLLGQSSVSTEENDYVLGTLWNEVSDTDDNTSGFTQDGKINFTLPQTVTQNWTTTTKNTVEAFWIRLRIISVSSPVNPNVDRIRIDTGSQYIKIPVVQGQTVGDNPLGSSNGAENQEFTLTFDPLIEGTLEIEVDEGGGFQTWSQQENFLNSNSASKHYTLDITADDISTIKFGDGQQGKIPTPGVDNIRAVYRIGADVSGNVGANTITVNKAGISFIESIYNPRQALGWTTKEGSTDEDLARLKIEGPATLRTRGRAITTDDCEFLATQYEDSNGSRLVARALAIEETFGVKTIELIVVGQGGALLTEAQRTDIDNYFNGNKTLGIDPVLLANHEITTLNYTPNLIDVTATVTGGNAEEIKNAVTALLNPEATFDDGVTKRWDFGDEVPFSIIISEIFEVDPINIKKVDLTQPTTDIQLGTRELPLAGTVTITVI